MNEWIASASPSLSSGHGQRFLWCGLCRVSTPVPVCVLCVSCTNSAAGRCHGNEWFLPPPVSRRTTGRLQAAFTFPRVSMHPERRGLFSCQRQTIYGKYAWERRAAQCSWGSFSAKEKSSNFLFEGKLWEFVHTSIYGFSKCFLSLLMSRNFFIVVSNLSKYFWGPIFVRLLSKRWNNLRKPVWKLRLN